MMETDMVFSLMKKLEGLEEVAYKDSLGYVTVGIGFNMDAAGARGLWEELGVQEDFDKVYKKEEKISIESAKLLFDVIWAKCVEAAVNRAEQLGIDYESLPEYHKFVLADIVYNTGSVSKWSKVFTNTEPKKVIFEARRNPKQLMDSRVAKIAYAFGIVGSLEEAKSIGLEYAKYIV